MNVEVVAVGTELLLGQIVNGNAATIGAALAERGFDAHHQQVVGDNHERMVDVFSQAISRSDAVIITGGIGPTQDDITREAICAVTGRNMVFSDQYAEVLGEWWQDRDRTMPESNLQQAEYPDGADLIPNPKGTAPGLALDHEGTLVFAVPGVSAEMEHMLHADILPRLATRSGAEEALVSRVLRTWDRSESDIAESLDDLYRSSTNPSLAFLASGGEITVRITAKAEDESAAGQLIEPMEAEIRARLGDTVFGADQDTIEAVLFKLLKELGYTIGTAESMTGGLVAAALTALAGSSAVMRGGLVAYDSELKQTLLGVEDVSKVVTAETAVAMASGGRELLGADVAVSVTGSAGPDPLEKPAGTLVIGVATPDHVQAREMRMAGDRERIRTYATTSALHLVRLALIGRWWKS